MLNGIDNKSEKPNNKIICDLYESEFGGYVESNKLGIHAINMAIKAMPSVKTNENIIQLENNKSLISIKAHYKYGLPSGFSPKILLLIALNEVKLTKSPVLRLRKIYLNFIRNYQKFTQNDDHENYDQMLRLFSAKITFFYKSGNELIKFDFWWNPLNGNKENINSSSTIVLSNDIFKNLIN